MVLADLAWLKGYQFFTDTGEILASGTINIYDATTTNLRTTYSDYNGSVANALNGSNQIVLAADGRLDESVYVPTGLWKYVLKDSSGNTIVTEDNIEGALDTSVFLTGTVTAETPVISKTADYSVVNGDQSKVINANPTGGSFTLTLPSAVTVGDGWFITVRHVGTANTVTLATVSAQTIDGSTTRLMSEQYETLTITSDGANWHVTSYGHASLDHGRFLGRSTTGDGPPEKFTIPFGQCQLAKSGSGLVLSPFDGNLLTINSAAEIIPDSAPSLSVSGLSNSTLYYVYAYMSSGVMTLEASTTSYSAQTGTGVKIKTGDATRTLVGMCYLLSGAFVDSVTQRYVRSYFNDPGTTLLNSFSTARTTTSTSYAEINTEIRIEFLTWSGEIFDISFNGAGTITNVADVQFTSIGFDGTTAEDSYTSGSRATSVSDMPTSLRFLKTGLSEGYHYATVLGKVSANTGTWNGSGTAGTRCTLRGLLRSSGGGRGPEGIAGIEYTFATSTTMGDPGAGLLRFNNATPSSVTAIAIDDTSAATGNPDVSAYITSWDNSTSTVKGYLYVYKVGGRSNFAVYQLDTLTDNSGWSQLNVTHIASNGSFSASDQIAVEFTRNGDAGVGTAGATGPTGSTSFNFDNATADADPGSGDFRLNNATAASATAAYFDNNNRGGSDVSAWLDTLDDSGNSTLRGYLHLFDATSPTTVFRIYSVSGSVVDGTGYRKVTIAHVVGAGSFTNGNEIVTAFFARGPSGAGDVSGPAAAVVNEIALYDDTTGKVLRRASLTGLVKATSGVASAATDGTDYFSPTTGMGQGKQTIWVPASAMIPATTSGPASAQYESSSNDRNMKVLDFDASADEHAHFNIAFPKGWNESTVTFQVRWQSTASDTDGVAWAMEATAISDNESLDAAWGTAVVVTDNAQSAAGEQYTTAESSALTIAGTPAEGDVCYFRIFRDVSDANDDMTEDARLIGAHVFFTTNAATDA